MEYRENLPVKWLRYLFYVHIASVAVSALGWVSSSSALNVWLGRAVTLGVVVCMYQLAPLNPRYKKSFTLRGVMLILTLITYLLHSSMLLTLAASVLSILATYQEYHAHSELVAQQDEQLSRRWSSLFIWEIIVSVLTTVLTMAATLIMVMGEIGTSAVVAVITVIMQMVSLVLGILYLVYLNRTAKLFDV